VRERFGRSSGKAFSGCGAFEDKAAIVPKKTRTSSAEVREAVAGGLTPGNLSEREDEDK
jgi:hypothetical protein